MSIHCSLSLITSLSFFPLSPPTTKKSEPQHMGALPSCKPAHHPDSDLEPGAANLLLSLLFDSPASFQREVLTRLQTTPLARVRMRCLFIICVCMVCLLVCVNDKAPCASSTAALHYLSTSVCAYIYVYVCVATDHRYTRGGWLRECLQTVGCAGGACCAQGGLCWSRGRGRGLGHSSRAHD